MHWLFSRRGFLQMALAASGGLLGWVGPLRKPRSATIGTSQGCDEVSRITTMRDSTGQVTKHFYDARGRVIKTIVYGSSVSLWYTYTHKGECDANGVGMKMRVKGGQFS